MHPSCTYAAPRCETPKSPPGDYNGCELGDVHPARKNPDKCETPKSPPGDYNFVCRIDVCVVLMRRVKHLNPRQGITTGTPPPNRGLPPRLQECETPKSPPGDYNSISSVRTLSADVFVSVKHLNPRQGITTSRSALAIFVKCSSMCETPESPPGDYNVVYPVPAVNVDPCQCETPESPPGDYNSGKETARQVVGRLKYVVVAVGSISIARGNEV